MAAESMEVLTVTSYPQVSAVGLPYRLQGILDPQKIQAVRAAVEGATVSLKVTIQGRSWQATLAEGFATVGTVVIRLEAFGASQERIILQLLPVSVRSPAVTLTVKQSTIFKAAPDDAATLPSDRQVFVPAGTVLILERYGVVDGHLKVVLAEAIAPVGTFGYFFLPHVSVSAPMTLRVLQRTIFKSSTAPSNLLADHQKAVVPADTELVLALEQTLTVENNHVQVRLGSGRSPVGTDGWFFLPHVQLWQLGAPLAPQLLSGRSPSLNEILVEGLTLTATRNTLIKAAPVESQELDADQKIALTAGDSYAVTGYAATAGHFLVRFVEPLSPIGSVGYVFWQHVQLSRRGRVIAYDPEMRTVLVKQNTLWKTRPMDSRQLAAQEMGHLSAGRVVGVDAYNLEGTHLRLVLTEAVAPVGTTGYLFSPHVTLRQGDRPIEFRPQRRTLGVPYFSQRDNPRDPFSTCNVTAIAMVLWYYGVRSRRGGQLEDELYQWIIDRYGAQARTDNAVLEQLYRAYGFSGEFSTRRTWGAIRHEIHDGRPVVLGGYFTHGGHIICAIGFDEQGLVVHDPYGDALTGYAQTEGRSLRYPNDYLRRVCGVDGDVWAHFIRPRRA
ncbi:MAG: C39 family peptidase [Oscillatoriales cyanobacterium SM2_2_1]|nr:C39 family peptidase [Oscillatoriales cyanobacterium SM2_2_1]